VLATTKGIVLRTVKYGETSLVITMYTEGFGLQSYLVNGARTERRSSMKANLFQLGNLLQLMVYHQPSKNLQRIKDAQLCIHSKVFVTDIVKSAIVMYLVELAVKTISEPEVNEELFTFFEESLQYIESNATTDLADFPIRFTLALTKHLGFGIQNAYTKETPYFDLQNGMFCSKQDLQSTHFVEHEIAEFISIYASALATEKKEITREKRKEVLEICIQYLSWHIPSMPTLKSPGVLYELFSS
jgi:DNA repair protein RecO (recombination protein O)